MREIVFGIVASVITFFMGYSTGKRKGKKNTQQIRAVCLCSHSIGTHVDMKGRCNATVATAKAYSDLGRPIDYKQSPCACLHYSGPELISTYSVRQITDVVE